MKHPFIVLMLGFSLALGISIFPINARPIHGGIAVSAPAAELTTVLVHNSSGSTISNQPVKLALNLAKADVPTGSKIEIRKNDGTTVVPTQEDRCHKWAQDNSRAICQVSIVEPDSITTGANATYRVFSVSGSPSTTPNVSTANITANTNIVFKSTTNLYPQTGVGTAETGVWDFLDVNYVLGNCTQYNGSTGYGVNPKCGWDIVASGPNRYELHLFQYARRETSPVFHNWLRTDMWVEFWGSGSTPCPCSVSTYVSTPNSYGPISGGSVGGSTMYGYTFGASLYNGANLIGSNSGGPNDARVSTVTFDSTYVDPNYGTDKGAMVFPGGAWTTVAGVSISSQAFLVTTTGSMPAGANATNGVYFAYVNGSNPNSTTKLPFYFWFAVDSLDQDQTHAVTITNNGTGTFTATPLIVVSPWSGVLIANTAGKRLWIGSGGTEVTAPPVMNAQEFAYMTQQGHAIPPYLKVSNGVTLWNNMPSQVGLGSTYIYNPNSWFLPNVIDDFGDTPGDNRVGYIDRPGIISLYAPFDTAAVQNSDVYAASFAVFHFTHVDETTGMPPVFNNGPNKAGATYPTLGTDQPNVRVVYNPGTWQTPPLYGAGPYQDGTPYRDKYGPLLGTSHMPLPQQASYLRNGDDQWLWEMQEMANAAVGTASVQPNETIAGTVYYRPWAGINTDNQTRGVAWGERITNQAQFFTPNNDPVFQYLTDLVTDSYANDMAIINNSLLTAGETSLGYFWVDVNPNTSDSGGAKGNGTYQWWQDDFVWQSIGQEAIRNEFPDAKTFLTSYFYKHVIGRMDANNTYGGGAGCLWVTGAHVVNPFAIPPSGATAWDLASLPTTWNAYYTNVTAQYGTHLNGQTSGTTLTVNSRSYPGTAGIGGPIIGQVITGAGVPSNTTVVSGSGTTWTLSNSSSLSAEDMVVSGQWDGGVWSAGGAGNPPWAGCAAQASTTWNTVIRDTTDSNPTVPNGYMNIATASPAIGAWLGVADTSTIYTTLRTYAYAGTCPTCGGVALNFRQFHTSGGDYSVPVFALGPPGAVN